PAQQMAIPACTAFIDQPVDGVGPPEAELISSTSRFFSSGTSTLSLKAPSRKKLTLGSLATKATKSSTTLLTVASPPRRFHKLAAKGREPMVARIESMLFRSANAFSEVSLL